jgi:hypothetical protein
MSKQSWNQPKRIVIPTVWRDGELQPLHGGKMPKLVEGALADIVVEATAFASPVEVSRFDIEGYVSILKSGDLLLAVMRPKGNPKYIPEAVRVGHAEPRPPERSELIPFTLEEDLILRLRGTKPAALDGCRCRLNTLGGKIVKSVNEAYTRLSEHYEKWRRSHSGNVFDTVYVLQQNRATSLDILRQTAAAEFEKKLIDRSKS